MLEVHIPSVGPEAEGTRQNPEKGHMVFRVEVLYRGRRHVVQRRYSEFHALHKRGILYLNQDVPKELLEFLSLRHWPTDPKASNWGSQLYHRPVVSFPIDPYICIPSPEPLPNMVVLGVLQGLYGFNASTAEAQPEAACHPAPVPPMP
ncbi:sorting nexin-22 isoform X2 [Cervus elaphus]|uniref:sorting nexin-22 isoform X2 n=1 Tax=Cervus canadensis TaxID=1574408 RepID=UPI001C9E9EA8|nr:sorting nexin-22 isoform X2 [Cervus canadensis]XP_043776103.1 sorting nexin-22 isoform X2 [Cervus elaphus]